jgi:hypothetical protein
MVTRRWSPVKESSWLRQTAAEWKANTQFHLRRVNRQRSFACISITGAWFWENDYYRYNREQLLAHDPVGAAAVEAAWTVND